MIRLAIVILCAGLMESAVAAEASKVEQGAAVSAVPAATAPAKAEAVSAVSAVSAIHDAAPQARVSETAETRAQQADVPVSKSGIPLDKRQGGDATKCLELATNQEIAACAEKFR